MTSASAESSANRALGASTMALAVACASMVAFLPPMLDITLDSIPRTALLGSAIAVGMLLHWVFLGIGAHRLQRSVVGWVALAVLLFPIGGATALILLGFFSDESAHHPPAPAPGA